MRSTKHRVFYLALFLSMLCLTTLTLPAVAQTLHLVIVADTRATDGIGPSVDNDRKTISRMFQWNVPKQFLNISVVSEPLSNEDRDEVQGSVPVTKNNILDAIRNLNVKSSDTIVFYYSGHGAYDDYGHFFSLSNKLPNSNYERIYFKEVQDEVKKKNPLLAVFLRDCCNVFQKSPPGVRAREPEITPRPLPFAEEISPLYDELFFKTTGIIDIIAAKKGQYAWCTEDGGCFTQSFYWTLRNYRQVRLPWQVIHGVVQVNTLDLAKEIQDQQTVLSTTWETRMPPINSSPSGPVTKGPTPDFDPDFSEWDDDPSYDDPNGTSDRMPPFEGDDGNFSPPVDTRPCDPPIQGVYPGGKVGQSSGNVVNGTLQRQRPIVVPLRGLRWRRAMVF